MQNSTDGYKQQAASAAQSPVGQVTLDWWRATEPPPITLGASTYITRAAVTSLAVPVPNWVSVNDVIVLALYIETTATVTPPAGFTQKTTTATTGTGAHTLRVYWHRAIASETGTYTFTWAGAARAAATAQRFTRVIPTGDPFETAVAASNSISSGGSPSVGVTTGTVPPGRRMLAWVGTNANTGTGYSPYGFTPYLNSTVSYVFSAYKLQARSGTTPSLTSIWSVSGPSCAWVGALIPVTPLPATVLAPNVTGRDDPAVLVPGFDSVTVDRAITSDLAPEVTLISGVTAATATVGLTGVPGDNTVTAGALYSPYRTESALSGIDVEGTPATVQLGLQVLPDPAPPEVFPQITGRLRDMQITTDATGSSASVQIVDAREDFRFTPRFPVAVGNDPVIPPSGLPQKPGLDVQWVVDQIARQAGYYASPPDRDSLVCAATMHGSAVPHVGTLRTAFYWDGVSTSTAYPVRFSPGRFALASTGAPLVSGQPYNTAQWFFSANQPQGDNTSMLYEAWHYLTPTHNDELGGIYDSTGINRRIIWRTDGAGHLGLQWSRDGITYVTNYPATARITTTGWVYVGWHILYGNVDTTIHIRVGNVTDTIIQATPTSWTGTAGGASTYWWGTEAVQVTTEPYTADAQMWNNTFVPNATLEPGLSELVAMPPLTSGTEAWSILQDIAKATAGVVMTDEAGVFRMWNRRHFGTASASTSIQRTLRASVPLESITVQRLADRIRNIIRATVTPFQIPAASVIWSSSETIVVPARTEVVRWVDLSPNQGYQIDTSSAIIPSGGALTNGKSGYRASRRQDGTGGAVTNVVMTITPFADSVKIAWYNPNGFPAWLVTPSSGYPAAEIGQPAAELVGRLVTQNAAATDTGTAIASTSVTVEYRDTMSITDYGERPLTLDGSVWMQNGVDALALAQDVGFAISRPCPQLSSVPIIADPSLQLGDLVLLTDESGATGINDPFWIVGISTTQNATEAAQALTLRPVARPGALLFAELGIPDRSTLDGRWNWG